MTDLLFSFSFPVLFADDFDKLSNEVVKNEELTSKSSAARWPADFSLLPSLLAALLAAVFARVR